MKKLLTSLFLFLCLGISALAAPTVSLAWDASPDADVIDYRIYSGQSSGNYNWSKDFGNVTNCVITNLVPGVHYWFVATAINAGGAESDPSNEIDYLVPAANTPPSISTITNQTFIVGSSIPPINFIIGDVETSATNLIVTAGSSNPALLPVNGIMFAGSGINRMVILTPISGVVGYSTVSITVSDGQGGTANTVFAVISQPVPEPTVPSVPQEFMIISAQ